jgi:hypothetical protein
MKTTNNKTMLLAAVLIFSLSLLSAAPHPARAESLTPSAELQVVGGDKCSAAWGLGLGLAAAALSPCSVVCAALAWYDLALIGAFCE